MMINCYNGQVIMFGDGPQPLTESKQKLKKEKVDGETPPAVRPDRELPPNFMDKHPVQVAKNLNLNVSVFQQLHFSS